MKWWAGSLQITISPAKFWNRLLSTDQLDLLQNDLPQKYEAGNSWNFNSTIWFSYPSFQLKVKIIDCLQNDGTCFFSTKRLGFYVLQGSMLLSLIQKTVKKTICSEHESYQMVEDMATPILIMHLQSINLSDSIPSSAQVAAASFAWNSPCANQCCRRRFVGQPGWWDNSQWDSKTVAVS